MVNDVSIVGYAEYDSHYDGTLVTTVDELLVTLMCMNDVFISDYIEYDSTAIIDGPSNYC
ncbi:hypothetical protein HMPREF0872_04175 [Veillonella montpellierensis DNF00314]|uniref:Uncharacterized protein n=1 Tax=Veillonella montpellierensis DNF00314 TaxID=1401067 RepID=A0A096AKG0_9FIRM|nr:hypothetical protein [Veillonella montpellierensis]KGF47593.1 hypothetical protein HMPREF0872_04175 [Veillonella montpellierensis DNF00314]